MISVIVPTIWKAQEIERMLPVLIDHDKIGEIIIIDNDPKARFFTLPSSDKIKVLKQKKNIFVNPAWNLGVQTAKYSKICLLSDDILFDENIFDLVYDKISDKNGVIGIDSLGIKNFFVKSPLMQIEPATDLQHWDGFGTLMFMHKKNYLPIPQEMKIYWGDAWIYDYNSIQCRQNYILTKFCIKTQMRTSSSGFSKNILEEEAIFLDFFKRMYESYVRSGKTLSPLMAENIYRMIQEYA